jgi:hypothetical protein
VIAPPEPAVGPLVIVTAVPLHVVAHVMTVVPVAKPEPMLLNTLIVFDEPPTPPLQDSVSPGTTVFPDSPLTAVRFAFSVPEFQPEIVPGKVKLSGYVHCVLAPVPRPAG